MSNFINSFFRQAHLAGIALFLVFFASLQASAAGVPPLNIAKKPLNAIIVTSPNVMYILDDSGSMDWDYLPDWAGANYCRTTGNFNDYTKDCEQSSSNYLPPARSSDFNSIYYNPAIRYTPAKNADGTSMPEQTTWTAVKDDIYGIQSTKITNLETEYPDTEWCTSFAYTDCIRNDNYIMPTDNNDVRAPRLDGKKYYIPHQAFSTGVAYVAVGPRNAPTKALKELGPHYYTINPGEYCDSAALTKCQATQDATYAYPAKVRWCSNETKAQAKPALTGTVDACQATRTSALKIPRYPTKFYEQTITSGTPIQTNEVLYVAAIAQVGTAKVNEVAAKAAIGASVSFSLILGSNCEGTDKASIEQVNVNGVDILPGKTNQTLSANDLAQDVKDRISSAPTPPYVATVSGSQVKLQASPVDGNITHSVSIVLSAGSCSVTLSPATPKFSGYAAATALVPAIPASSDYVAGKSANCTSPVTLSGLSGPTSWGFNNGDKVCQTFSTPSTNSTQWYGSFSRVDIVSSNDSYPKGPDRTDCGATCSYAQEMTNFANWWTYYHTRMQAMKTSTSLAFDAVNDKTRVGFSTISDTTATNGSTFLNIGNFDSGQKDSWYTTLFNSKPNGNTPLREALSQTGRIYANKIGADPVQYSCQQNFALLTTDGYWNGSNPSGQAGKDVSGALIGNQDNGALIPRPKREGTAAAGSLADVAKYYYDTDLRTGAFGNCEGALGAGTNVCDDGPSSIVQRMSTYTLGLGVDGTLSYSKSYKTDTTGDFKQLVLGTKTWPSPFAGDDEKIDDLWHAAVNGEGSYFSAKNPNDVTQGLADALSSIGATRGSAAPSGISNRILTATDNFSYRATFISDQWTGNVEKRTIDPVTGALSNTIENCVEDIAADLPLTACTGINTSAPKVGVNSDTRTIYINSSAGLAPFTYANLPASKKLYFESPYLDTKLSQWGLLSTTQQTVAVKDGLVGFLRGRTGLEDRSSNLSGLTDNRLFRYRFATLGDIAESQPVYVGKPTMDYADPGYATYKTANASRAGTVYVGANDGMLHALDANTLEERWAYVPTEVMPKLWYLADRNYKHENYVNATVSIADARINGDWKTILIGGFNGGGRGYYALDVTDPTTPKLLWEFTDADMGYTFGKPKVVKNTSGDWVVLMTSGYNNTPDYLKATGDGGGHLYVFDLNTKSAKKYSTGEGSATLPSGLAKVSAFVYEPQLNNTSTYVYGGDLAGNVWRFDISTAPSASNPLRFATLTDGALPQPITTEPELALIDGKRMVYVGTGQFLEPDDRTTVQKQTIYGIQDDDVASTYNNPRTTLAKQTLSAEAGVPPTRTGSGTPADLNTGRGWYADLPISGERQYIDSQLYSGNLIVTSNVPTGTDCQPGGTSWLNVFNYRTGSVVVSTQLARGSVGGNLYQRANGDVFIKNDTPGGQGLIGNENEFGSLPPVESLKFQGRRSIWRELIN